MVYERLSSVEKKSIPSKESDTMISSEYIFRQCIVSFLQTRPWKSGIED